MFTYLLTEDVPVLEFTMFPGSLHIYQCLQIQQYNFYKYIQFYKFSEFAK